MKLKKLSTCLNATIGIVVIAVILVIVNLIFKPVSARIDCTADKLYTLSDGTKNTLKNLTEPVSIRFYYSKDVAKMPVIFKNYATRVEDLLQEYKQLAGKNLEIKKLNPKPDTDAEDSAKLDGITGKSMDVFGEDQIYLGIAVSCGNRTETLPFLSPDREKLLEYDITRAILGVKSANKPKVAVLSSLKVMGGYDNPMAMMQGQGQSKPAWIVISELKRTYDVVELPVDTKEIAADISVVVAIHPKNLSEQTMFALDQFILRGGKLIAYIDPMSVADLQTQQTPQHQYAPPAISSSLPTLLKAWGIEFDTEQIVLDNLLAGNMGNRERNPMLLNFSKEYINAEDPTTAQLTTLAMFCGGSFKGTPADGLTKTVLIHSSKESLFAPKMMVLQGAMDMSKRLKADDLEKELAIKLTGHFKTAYPDGYPAVAPAEDGKSAPEPPKAPEGGWLKESKADSAVVLIGDADILFDPLCVERQQIFGQVLVQPVNHNLALAQNLIEYMSGDSALFGIRSRGGQSRQFSRVKKMEEEANKRFEEEIAKLEGEVQDVRRQISQLQRDRKPGDKELLSAEQRDLLKKYRQKEVEAKKKLQNVRKQLRKDIDSLENNVMLLNIGLMPLLVAIAGIAYAFLRRQK
ncbi:MAG: Gldg family protein [Victivallales bacterium]|nr:Gldg family protein [Victivallales bacterium]